MRVMGGGGLKFFPGSEGCTGKLVVIRDGVGAGKERGSNSCRALVPGLGSGLQWGLAALALARLGTGA